MSFLTARQTRIEKPCGLRESSRNNTPKPFVLFFFLALLIFWQPVLSAFGEEKAPPESESQILFEKGKLYFKAGNFKAAYATFFILFKHNPGNPDINFYLGRAAFEIGNYEAAIMAFERILIHKPGTERVKLEIARCHLKLGSTEMGKKLLKEVLDTNPPVAVKENIQNLLLEINASQKKHFFSGMIALSAGFDDNAATAPSQTTIAFSQAFVDSSTGAVTEITLPTTVPGAESDIIYSHTALLNHHYKVPDTIFSWRSSAILYNSVYTEDGDLNINYFSLGTGPALQKNRFYMDAKGLLTHMLLDGTEYLTSVGGSTSASYLFTAWYLSNVTLKWENRNYVGDIPVFKDSTNLNLTNTHSLKIGPSILGVTVAGETEDAKDEENSYDRLESGLSYAFQFPHDFTAQAGYTFQKSDYKQEDEIFQTRRSDDIHTLRAGISKVFFRGASGGRAVTGFVDYAFTNAKSNQATYDYTKNVATLGGAFIF